MKKKLLAVILTLAMIMTMFSGCGQKDSTYFKEFKEISTITTGTGAATIDVTYKGDDVSEVPETFQDKDGNIAVSLKMEGTTESTTKSGAKISIKLGQETEYSELTTFVLEDKKIYLTVDPMIAFVKKIDAETATEFEAGLAQMGISGAVSLDLDKVLEAVGEEWPESSDDKNKAAYDFVNTFVDAMEKNFKDLEGQEEDAYTLKVNGDNADKAVDGVASFLKNDAKELLEACKKLMNDVYGENNELMGTAVESYDELIQALPDATKEVEDNKEDIVKTIKDNNINMVSKIQVNGKKGSREGKMSFESGNIKFDDATEFSMNINGEFKEGKSEIKDIIPENASDITTLLVTMLNAYSNYDYEDMDVDSDLDMIGGADDATDIEIQ